MTTSAVIALPACFSTPTYENACNMSDQNRQARDRQEMTIDKLLPTQEQQGQLRSAFQHAVRSLLLDNLEGFTTGGDHTAKITKKVTTGWPTIRELGRAGEKTDFYPPPALNEEEASVKGTIRVVQALIRDTLKLAAEVACSKLRFFVGDWMTIRNLRSMKRI